MGKESTTLDTLHVDNLDSFNWDPEVSEINFFGDVEKKPEELEKTPEEAEVSKEKEKEKKTETIVKTDEELEKEEAETDAIFKNFSEGEETIEEESKKIEKVVDEEAPASNSNTLAIISFLKENSPIEIPEDELTELESLEETDRAEALKDYFEQAIEEKFAESVKDLPDSVKNIVKYVSQGGNLETLLSTMYKSKGNLSENLDMEDEKNQEIMVREQLQEEGYDTEYIDSQLDFLKDSGKLKVTAEKRYEKWNKARQEAEKAEITRVEANKRKQRESEINFKKDISSHVSSVEDIRGFKLSKKDVTEMPDYIGSQSVKLEDGRVITPFYNDLFKAMKDKDKLVVLAKILREDFDFSSFTKAIDTKRTTELKKNLQRQNDTKSVKSSAGSSQTPKRLADML